jgi:hypothetical protein
MTELRLDEPPFDTGPARDLRQRFAAGVAGGRVLQMLLNAYRLNPASRSGNDRAARAAVTGRRSAAKGVRSAGGSAQFSRNPLSGRLNIPHFLFTAGALTVSARQHPSDRRRGVARPPPIGALIVADSVAHTTPPRDAQKYRVRSPGWIRAKWSDDGETSVLGRKSV